jgi:hypothetical protein
MKGRWALLSLITLVTTISSCAFADWAPEDIELADLSHISGAKYKNQKASVIESLKGSWCSPEKGALLMDLIRLIQPQLCVEVGAWTGSSVLPVAMSLKFNGKGKVYAIDAWSNQIATRYWSDQDPNKPWWSTVDMKAIKQTFNNLLRNWQVDSYCVPVQDASEKAAARFKNETIDFLHLDGDYSEQGSLADVENYLPKVKTGGYILLSHLFTMINGKQPKLKSFKALVQDCEIICEIERDNAILFRKI